MDLELLRRFLAVIDHGSLGEAARELRLQQPALSKSIKRLEASIGVQLFDRTKDGMVANQFGERLVQRARTLSLNMDRANAEIREMLDGKRGSVRISVAVSVAGTVLPRVLERFRLAHPRVVIIVTEEPIEQAAPRVEKGSLDFAIGTVSLGAISDGLVVNPLFTEDVVPVASSSHPLAERRHLSPADVCEAPWMIAPATVFQSRLFEVFIQAGLAVPEERLYYGSVTFAKRALCATGYIGMLARSTVELEVAEGMLSILRAPDFVWKRTVGIVFREGVQLMPAAQEMLDLICKESSAYHKRRQKGRLVRA